MMKHTIGILIGLLSLFSHPLTAQQKHIICNPMNISYRFRLEEPVAREAADPTVVYFKGNYYLFASKSGGYWYSRDLSDWHFVETNQIPTEDYAPTALALQDTLYFLASSNQVYRSTDPQSGKWQALEKPLPFGVVDPDLFMDNGHVYLFWGCSDREPLYGVELDALHQFQPIGERKALVSAHPDLYGWEVPGDANTDDKSAPWIEGAWVNKYQGKYYLQYACPGTQFKSYADAVYIADQPLGPYRLAEHNPFAYKPAGFIAGAGHGSTFQDRYGNYWHIGTVTISVKHMFERRIALYPTFFDAQGTLYADTQFGDYPMILPDKKIQSAEELFPGWMLLSYGKSVQVSSSDPSYPASNMVDEDIRTYWAAKTGGKDEWATIDLGKMDTLYALQINFAEHGVKLFGRVPHLSYQYVIEGSRDAKHWESIVDKSHNTQDYAHDFLVLDQPLAYRYVRIRNIKIPGGSFALSDFRIFGKGNGKLPAQVRQLQVVRDRTDKRKVFLSWPKAEGAMGYCIRYGADKDKCYQSHMVYGGHELHINNLNVNQDYYFTVDAFNEQGLTKGGVPVQEGLK